MVKLVNLAITNYIPGCLNQVSEFQEEDLKFLRDEIIIKAALFPVK